MEPLALGGKRLGVLGRFIVYGIMGLCIEFCFTSVMDLATGAGDLRLKGYSYLWMHPIWGGTLLMAEGLMMRFQRMRLSRFTRAFIAMAASFTIEYVTGALLVMAVGRCPWDYTASPWNVHGLIRLDYAPFWLMCGWACEPLTRFVRRIRIFAREAEFETASGS
ncbi:putative ABC transporter permease [Stigmatella aurantiaca]|nr:putative ABC transporter permease [Stigmatella aurantiaca]